MCCGVHVITRNMIIGGENKATPLLVCYFPITIQSQAGGSEVTSICYVTSVEESQVTSLAVLSGRTVYILGLDGLRYK